MLLPVVATLGSSSNEPTYTSTTISCRLPFLLFSNFFLHHHQVWGLRESKEPGATAFHASPLTADTLMDICALLPSESE